ncbi:uncharacterized protein LOC26529434 [Drosophila willistoni]|uniref:uncharacterized protein LOC26529434 n=1 Tax=Drosophila willistoni TaxID=7260 RepID=UPI000C26C60B|nr:uncharacterized protein LOC26529434 [Drosophila willistoni]
MPQLTPINLLNRRATFSFSSKTESASNETDSEEIFYHGKPIIFQTKRIDNFGTSNYQSVLDIQTVLLEYKQFRAARTIQRVFRSWHEYHKYRKMKKAAIVIQKWWRRFFQMNYYYHRTEEIMQKCILDYYHKSATKIQALFRGWWSRKYLYDFFQLKRINIHTLSELLFCIACEMKAMKYKGLLPGVYSLRNSPCLLKCEKFLSSHDFRFHNELIQTEWNSIHTHLNDCRRSFQDAFMYTRVPYPGHNYYDLCQKIYEPQAVKPRSSKIDNKILRTIAKFTSARDTYKQRRQKKFTRGWEAHKMPNQKAIRLNKKFCGQLMKSMEHWRNIDGTLIFPNNLLEKYSCLNLIFQSVNEQAKPISEICIPGCISMAVE